MKKSILFAQLFFSLSAGLYLNLQAQEDFRTCKYRLRTLRAIKEMNSSDQAKIFDFELTTNRISMGCEKFLWGTDFPKANNKTVPAAAPAGVLPFDSEELDRQFAKYRACLNDARFAAHLGMITNPMAIEDRIITGPFYLDLASLVARTAKVGLFDHNNNLISDEMNLFDSPYEILQNSAEENVLAGKGDNKKRNEPQTEVKLINFAIFLDPTKTTRFKLLLDSTLMGWSFSKLTNYIVSRPRIFFEPRHFNKNMPVRAKVGMKKYEGSTCELYWLAPQGPISNPSLPPNISKNQDQEALKASIYLNAVAQKLVL